MTKLELNKKNLIIVSGTAVFLFILIIFLYLPMAGKLKKKTIEWNSLKSELKVEQDNLKLIQECRIDKKLIKENELSSIIDIITREGRTLFLNFKSITQKELKYARDTCPVLPVQMEIEARYEQLGRFLGALEGLKDSVITIENFTIRRDERILPNIHCSLAMNIYLTQD